MCEPIDNKICNCIGNNIICLCGICQECHRKIQKPRRSENEKEIMLVD